MTFSKILNVMLAAFVFAQWLSIQKHKEIVVRYQLAAELAQVTAADCIEVIRMALEGSEDFYPETDKEYESGI